MKIYTPNLTQIDMLESVGFIAEMIVRIESPVKLSRKLRSGEIECKNPDAREVHFLRFESEIGDTTLQVSRPSLSSMLTFVKNVANSDVHSNYTEWIISDFDHYLRGNPFVEFDKYFEMMYSPN